MIQHGFAYEGPVRFTVPGEEPDIIRKKHVVWLNEAIPVRQAQDKLELRQNDIWAPSVDRFLDVQDTIRRKTEARIGRDSSRLRKMVAGSRCARDTTKPRLNRTLPDSPTEDALSGLPGVMVRCNRTEVKTPQPIDVPPKVAGRPGRSTERNGINIRAPSMHVAQRRAAAAPGSRRTD